MSKKVTFKELFVGDRFLDDNDKLWTKICVDAAREHCDNEINLDELGYGYIGAAICSFEPDDKITFVSARQTMLW